MQLELSQEQEIKQAIYKYDLAVIDAFNLCQRTTKNIFFADGDSSYIKREALKNIETVRGKILNMYKLYQELLSVI